jgi:multicomponent Na+:H+ antiporter subunit A
LARLHPVLGGTLAWMVPLVVSGATTAVWGSVAALGQTDLKRILAYTTLMALGIITMFLGGRTTPALTAAATFLMVHAIYKSALFLIVGSIDHQAGTRQLDAVGGVGRFMPLTATALLMGTLSMAGFPLFLGFIGKEIMYKGALTEEVFPGLATTAALAANSLMTAVAAVLTLKILFGRTRRQGSISEAPWQMWCGPLLLSGIGLGFGLIPDWVGRWLIQPAVQAFHPTTEDIQLKLFHGINEPLLLSMLTLLLGSLVYLARRRVHAGVLRIVSALPLTMSGVYDRGLTAVVQVAEWQTRILQNGSLFRYLAVIFSTLLVAVGGTLLLSGAIGFDRGLPAPNAWQWLLMLVMLFAVPVVVRSRSRLLAICGLGVIGAGIAVIFLTFGAPDLALTQLLVETLTLIIAAIVLLKLPKIDSAPDTGRLRRMTGLLLALGCGSLVTGLLLAVMGNPVDRTLTAFYEQASYLKAHGRNIVNVILVDFRSLDTLGEIVVVAASALAALSLIRKTESDP